MENHVAVSIALQHVENTLVMVDGVLRNSYNDSESF